MASFQSIVRAAILSGGLGMIAMAPVAAAQTDGRGPMVTLPVIVRPEFLSKTGPQLKCAVVVRHQQVPPGGLSYPVEVPRNSVVLFSVISDTPTNSIALPSVSLTYTGVTELREHGGDDELYYADVIATSGAGSGVYFDLIACVATLDLH